ncbi:MCE family protein [Skermania piniformis]|uniref:MCE family protein n=1 Tax=Skermania pinensis TaxID=39122 RepID=A0ABX8SDY3_9ACTN|nr:MCE family protein [Skermania piniformis]QXQ15372.1 MCE family protein [Skermania piniformis]
MTIRGSRIGRTLVQLVVVSAVGATSACAGAGSDHAMSVVAEFDNAAGLYVGNTVAVLGMPVGTVTAVEPRGTNVEVTMEIDRDIRIPADAKAVTLSTSVLTDRHVEFTPAYTDGPEMADGTRLGLDRTRTPVDFDRLLGAGERLSGSLQGATPGDGPVARLLGASAAIAGNSGPELRQTLDQLSTALRLGDDRGLATQDTLNQLMDQVATLLRAAAANDQTIRQFGGATGQLGQMAADLNIGTGDTGAKAVAVLRDADALLTDNADLLAATLGDGTTVTKALVDYRDQLAEFLDVTPMLLDNAWKAVDFDTGGIRVRSLLEKVAVEGQALKEVCNILGLRQLGCATGTLQDFGPDWGITSILEGMTRLPR